MTRCDMRQAAGVVWQPEDEQHPPALPLVFYPAVDQSGGAVLIRQGDAEIVVDVRSIDEFIHASRATANVIMKRLAPVVVPPAPAVAAPVPAKVLRRLKARRK